MRICVISDSIALPRETPEVCAYADTWPARLKSAHEVHQISIGGATSGILAEQVHYHKSFNADLAIVQSGIVDCTPRALSKFEVSFLKRFSITRKAILPFLHRNRVWLRQKRKVLYTYPEQFESDLKYVQSSFQNTIALGIVPGGVEYEKKVPGIMKQQMVFNGLLKSVFKDDFISLDEIPVSGIMSDHVHLNAEGHDFIYQRIIKMINSKFS